MLRLMLHLRIMGENGILFVLKNLIKFNLKKKTEQGCLFSKTVPGLLWFIYRPRCELSSFKRSHY